MRRGKRIFRAVSAAALACVAAGAIVIASAAGAGPRARAASTPVLAFVREASTGPAYVWVSAPNGSGAHQLFKGNEPLVSPNGAMIAATSTGNPLLLYSSSGTLLHAYHARGSYAVPASWSPDSRYLAVELVTTAVKGVAGAGLEVIDTTTGAVSTVARGVVAGASFTVDGSDRIVYGLSSAHSQVAAYVGPVNLFDAAPDGSGVKQLTTDGHSLNPLCGAKGIAFDHATPRSKTYSAYQVWLLNGSTVTPLTHMKIGKLVEGLVPIAFSADGNRMIAEFEGQDTGYAWSIQISPLQVHQVLAPKGYVEAGSISADGRTLLIDQGAFQSPPDRGTVETVPFPGVKPITKLTKGAFPSWNG